MTDLTKASEALLADLRKVGYTHPDTEARIRAIEAAVRSDTLADVATRLPEALHAVLGYGEVVTVDGSQGIEYAAAAILAHLGGPR